MIPENRLAILLDQVKAGWINDCMYHNTEESPSLYHDHICDPADFPNRSIHELRDHENEVWHLAFSNDGTRLATASQDKTVVIYDVTNNFRFLLALGDHDAGVCYVSWSPDDSKLITCTREQDNSLRVWDTKVRVNLQRYWAATNLT
jgi:WD repeat-containing protein 26